jgi:hypothetical protein
MSSAPLMRSKLSRPHGLQCAPDTLKGQGVTRGQSAHRRIKAAPCANAKLFPLRPGDWTLSAGDAVATAAREAEPDGVTARR